MWENPKTNWVADDYFNAADYNRIVNNINTAFDFSVSMYGSYEVSNMMVNADYTSIPYADDWNAITENIKAINEHTYNFDLPQSNIYVENASSPNYEQFNKWESSIEMLMHSLRDEAKAIPRLSIVCGRKVLGVRM